MTGELAARTRPGADLVALAEWLAGELAAGHDRREALALVRESGYLTAPIPEALGGLGVDSVHDLAVASGRLARGDASLAAGIDQHLVVVATLARRLELARAAGDTRGERALADALAVIARDDPLRDVIGARFDAVAQSGGSSL